jgi:hypothetical protein
MACLALLSRAKSSSCCWALFFMLFSFHVPEFSDGTRAWCGTRSRTLSSTSAFACTKAAKTS